MDRSATPPVEIPQLVKPAVPLQQVTDVELNRYAELVYRRTGIRIPPQKKALLSNRLRRRLRETGIEGFSAYFSHLQRLPARDPEWDAFLQEITTHETYLFRDESHWTWFRSAYLPFVASQLRSGKRAARLRVWSAACSTGDEAFTIACCIADVLRDLDAWNIQIVGTDIGVDAVQQATQAVFGERAMRLAPESYKRRFFRKATNANVWQARPALKKMTKFRQHNLMTRLAELPFDVVFLKNVLIYFDNASKQRVIEHVKESIRPGGVLVVGPADGASEFVRDFKRHQAWLYQKPMKEPK